MINHTPQINETAYLSFAQKNYQLEIKASKPLPSERDQNVYIQTTDGQEFILKIANGAEDPEFLAAQSALLNRIAETESLCPKLTPSIDGKIISELDAGNGQTYLVRLVSYLSGTPLGAVTRQSPALMSNLGTALGKIDAATADFDHPAAHHTFHWDLAHAADAINQYRPLVQEPAQQAQINHFMRQYEKYVRPHLGNLRQSVIHNDANDYNIIVGGGHDLYSKNQQVMGVIDFGDIVYSHTINNLAITIAYAILDKDDPLETAAQITASYHLVHPLTETEVGVLFGLVAMRLCVSACIAAHNIAQRPDDPYLAISQQPIRRTFPKLVAISYRWATAVLRHACGFPPTPKADHVVAWLQENTKNFGSVLAEDLTQTPLIPIDLSIASPLLPGDPAQITEPEMTADIFNLMGKNNVDLSVGLYDEPRLIYTADMFASGDFLHSERRTIHLGIDLFAPAGTPVFAPYPATVEIANVNDNDLDYGGVIVLRHETSEGVPFYTLYGHLSHASPQQWRVGQTVAQGTEIARFGIPAENGGWVPHLHFQVMTDLLGMGGDFPGVGRASQRPLWYQLSPDPNFVLGIPENRLPTSPPSKDATLSTRKERIGRNLSIGYKDHLKIVRGWKQYLYDETGQKYLDAYNNVPHVGHSHPRVVSAITQQAPVLNTNTRYLHDTINRYANKLVETMPDPLSVCFFVNSGSEANELALRLARAHTNQQDIIVQEGAYHGHTNTLIDISPYKHDGPGGRGAPDWVHTVPIADTYRGPFKADDPQAAEKYADQVKLVTEELAKDGRGIAGFIVESYPSVGGQIIHPDGYLAQAFAHIRQVGGLCIADEVQTGYGRVGTDFYAFVAQNVIPDIVVLGKPIGNGFPIGAVITTPEIAASFDNGMEFFSTFGGSTLSCTVGLTVLETVLDENLQAHAEQVGSYLLEQLRPLADKHPLIGDIRGSGLFLGIELVHDRETLEPAAVEASYISNRMRDHHILLGTDGPLHNVVKIRPPMPFTIENADFLVQTLDKVLSELGQ